MVYKTHLTFKIDQHNPRKKLGVNSGDPEAKHFLLTSSTCHTTLVTNPVMSHE